MTNAENTATTQPTETPKAGTADATAAGYVPAVPDKLRTAVYYAGLIVAAVSFIVIAMAGELDLPRWVETLSGAVGTAFGGIASGLGVAYSPSRYQLTRK